ncbi:MAG: ArsR/SmtB family transcription factor [Candidatus Latescibacterota bacterium]
MRNFMTVIKALADENRVRTLMALRDRELCVCDIIELLGLAPSTVSKHLSILYQAGFLESRKDGRWVYYRLADGGASLPVTKAIEWVVACLNNDPKIIMDMQTLKKMGSCISADMICSKRNISVDKTS